MLMRAESKLAGPTSGATEKRSYVLDRADWLTKVPFLDNWMCDAGETFDVDDLIELGSEHCEGASAVDASHIREGCVIRGESVEGLVTTKAVKRKSHAFLSGEGKVAAKMIRAYCAAFPQGRHGLLGDPGRRWL